MNGGDADTWMEWWMGVVSNFIYFMEEHLGCVGFLAAMASLTVVVMVVVAAAVVALLEIAAFLLHAVGA